MAIKRVTDAIFLSTIVNTPKIKDAADKLEMSYSGVINRMRKFIEGGYLLKEGKSYVLTDLAYMEFPELKNTTESVSLVSKSPVEEVDEPAEEVLEPVVEEVSEPVAEEATEEVVEPAEEVVEPAEEVEDTDEEVEEIAEEVTSKVRKSGGYKHSRFGNSLGSNDGRRTAHIDVSQPSEGIRYMRDPKDLDRIDALMALVKDTDTFDIRNKFKELAVAIFANGLK